MTALPHSTRSLVHQVISLIEEFHTVRAGGSQPRACPDMAVSPQEHVVKLGWPKPNANRDLAARVARELVRHGKGRVGYLALGETAVHAVARVLFQIAEVDPSKVPTGDLAETDFPGITAAAGKLAFRPLIFSDCDVPASRIQEATRRFVEHSQLDCLVVDDPDVPTLKRVGLPPEQEHWRIRMEFREAVRGSRVELYLPG